MIRTTLLATALAMLFCVTDASAQRTAEGESLAQVCAGTGIPFSSDRLLSASFGKYMLHSYWKVSLESASTLRTESSPSVDPFDFNDKEVGSSCRSYSFHADWAYRLLSSYSRSVGVYAGAGAFLGIGEEKTDQISQGRELFFGLRASAVMEVFITRRIALVAELGLPHRFGDGQSEDIQTPFITPQAQAGLRLNF